MLVPETSEGRGSRTRSSPITRPSGRRLHTSANFSKLDTRPFLLIPSTPLSVPRLLTLTTDFGLRDAYVAAMKGVIHQIHPEVRLVDVTHQISAQDIMEAAFVLREVVPHYPDGSVHLVVVDPGVGSDRRAIALRWQDQWFVGPDNGVFALVLGQEDPDEIVELDDPSIWHTDEPSTTFHGRDIFAPAAAHLARGASLSEVGSPIEELTRLHWALPISDEEGVQGWIVHIDHFGNCITNIPERLFADYEGKRIKGYVGNAILDRVHRTYSDVEEGEPVMLFGSSGFLEIAINGGDASQMLGIRKGASVNLLFSEQLAS